MGTRARHDYHYARRGRPLIEGAGFTRTTTRFGAGRTLRPLRAADADIPVSAKPERCAGGGKAGAALIAVGQGALDGGPEGGGVARLADMGEFVDDDVVDQGRR